LPSPARPGKYIGWWQHTDKGVVLDDFWKMRSSKEGDYVLVKGGDPVFGTWSVEREIGYRDTLVLTPLVGPVERFDIDWNGASGEGFLARQGRQSNLWSKLNIAPK
jgi:hypothetical protein